MVGNVATVLEKPAFRKIEWLKRDIAIERRDDGTIILKSRIPLQPYERHIPVSLAKWAKLAPERTWLAQRGGPDRAWRKVSYGEAKRTVDGLTQGLLNLKLGDGRPVAILSGNSIEHALMTQAAMVEVGKAWQKKKAEGGWACLQWPKEYGGRGATPIERVIWQQEEGVFGKLTQPFQIGEGMQSPG